MSSVFYLFKSPRHQKRYQNSNVNNILRHTKPFTVVFSKHKLNVGCLTWNTKQIRTKSKSQSSTMSWRFPLDFFVATGLQLVILWRWPDEKHIVAFVGESVERNSEKSWALFNNSLNKICNATEHCICGIWYTTGISHCKLTKCFSFVGNCTLSKTS